MNIIIPACGQGKRFSEAGYEVIKPLIPVCGTTMIEKVIKSLQLRPGDSLHIVTNQDLKEDEVIQVHQQTCGAAETALLAIEGHLNDKRGPLLLIDCDAFYNIDVIDIFRKLESTSTVRAGVLCFEESSEDKKLKPKYSYVKVNSSSDVVSIAEKVRIAELANTGAYWFADIQEFRSVAHAVISEKKFQTEAYISSILQEYLRLQKVVKACKIEQLDYDNVGTPDCLESYLSKQKYAFLFDLDGTLINTENAYTQAWFQLLKNKGAYVNKEFFVKHISGLSDMQVSERFHIDVDSKQKDEIFLSKIDEVVEIPGAASFVKQCQQIGLVCIVTNSNRAAARALLTKINLENVQLIASEDAKSAKPNPDPYTKALRALGVSSSKTIVFEDSKVGVMSARSANCRFVVSVSNQLQGCDTHLDDFLTYTPDEVVSRLISVSHLSEELSTLMERPAVVYPVRISGGYIADILSASCGLQNFILKLENKDQGVLQSVSDELHLHSNECIFYKKFGNVAPVRTPAFYGVLEGSRGIVLEDLSDFGRPPEFSLDMSLKIVEAIANMHVHFSGASLDCFPEKSSFMIAFMKKMFPIFKRKWENTVGKTVMNQFEHSVNCCDDTFALLKTPPVTLIHGDLKLPNLFWDYLAGGKPIFIDWQYACAGKGIEDIVFMLIESCPISLLDDLAKPIITSYYDKVQGDSGVTIPAQKRNNEVLCALGAFPLFVAIWFGTIDADKLVEPNFPFLFILRLSNAYRIFHRK